MSLIFVALGAILLWFLIAPFLKSSPAQSPQDFDPRVTCSICGELREPDQVIERELREGRFGHVCGYCIRELVRDYEAANGALPDAPASSETVD